MNYIVHLKIIIDIDWFTCGLCIAKERTSLAHRLRLTSGSFLIEGEEIIVHLLTPNNPDDHHFSFELISANQTSTNYMQSCLCCGYINVASFIHSGITNWVKVVCFKAFMHKSNSNLCSKPAEGYAILCNIFLTGKHEWVLWHCCFFPHDYRMRSEQILYLPM